MLQSSSSCLTNDKENLSDKFFLIENIRLVENEIKLLKKIASLESELFKLEANKENSSSKNSQQCNDTIMNDANVSIQVLNKILTPLKKKDINSDFKFRANILKQTFQLPPINTKILQNLTKLKKSVYNNNRSKLKKDFKELIDYTQAIIENEFNRKTSFNNKRESKSHGYTIYQKCIKACGSLWTIHFDISKKEATFSCRKTCEHLS